MKHGPATVSTPQGSKPVLAQLNHQHAGTPRRKHEMPHANLTGNDLRYLGPRGEIKTITATGRTATADTVNHDHQGATDIVPADVLVHARPIAPDQYFAAPVFDAAGLAVALQYDDGRTLRIDRHVEFWGSAARRIDLVVTRHESLMVYLSAVGLIDMDTPIINHATVGDVKGKHVLGVLPHHLSQHTASITEIPMALTREDREAMQAGDLPLDRVREIAGDPITYKVERVG